MARILKKDEINRLYEFVEVKEIPFYDVQTEIVDHLASMMEDRWAAGSQLELEPMFLAVYKDFGEVEWRQLWVAKERLAWKKVWHEARELIWQLWTWPGILGIILPVLLLYQILEYLPMAFRWLNYVVLGLSGVVLMGTSLLFQKGPSKRYYFSYLGYLQIFSFGVWMAGALLTMLIAKAEPGYWGILFFACLYVTTVVLTLVMPLWLRLKGVRRFFDEQYMLVNPID